MTSSLTSTHHPPSTNLTIPTTQNTAPVLSFSCLYTHDLRRKAKRWQDGILRFHTFNKRVMVYDVPRNFIGDTHWREPQPIQDGDELQLEKGILIQVGEQVERTETDLSELLEKRKPKPAAVVSDGSLRPGPPPVQAPAQSHISSTLPITGNQSTPAISSHLRPKTLNAVLGRPQGPVGRAALPIKSPAEYRREKENEVVVEEGRSPKRRRVQHPATTIPTVSPSTMRRNDQLPKALEKAGMSHHQATAGTGSCDSRIIKTKITDSTTSVVPKHSGCPEAVNISQRPKKKVKSNRDGSGSGADSARASDGLSPKRSISRRQRQDTREEELKSVNTPPVNPDSRPKSNVNRAATSSYTTQDPTSTGRHPPSRSERNVEANEDEIRPENLLRIAPSKPRRKLMYRDLLPLKAPARQTTPSSKMAHGHNLSPESLPRDTRGSRSTPLDPIYQARRGRSRSVLSRKSEESEISPEQAQVLLRKDENHLSDKEPSSDANHNQLFSESLFLTQPIPEALLNDSSPQYSRPPLSPPKANHATEEARSIQKQAAPEMDALVEIPNTPPPDAGTGPIISEHLSLSQPSPNSAVTETLISRPNQATLPSAPADIDRTPSSTKPARALTATDPVLPQQPPNNTNPPPPPQPHPKSDIIKAALPPYPHPRPSNAPTTRSTRPFTRCTSDLSAQSTSTRPTTRGLPRTLSNDFIPPKITKPPPLIHPRTITTTHDPNEAAKRIPDTTNPTSAQEQLLEPWSREAWDLFGFDGVDKRLRGCNGGEGGGGRGADGWLVASQGFV
ncbi:MAG: hypothetical protein Q9182_002624 [Xanthomendoza sp. 2 TL-2023]